MDCFMKHHISFSDWPFQRKRHGIVTALVPLVSIKTVFWCSTKTFMLAIIKKQRDLKCCWLGEMKFSQSHSQKLCITCKKLGLLYGSFYDIMWGCNFFKYSWLIKKNTHLWEHLNDFLVINTIGWFLQLPAVAVYLCRFIFFWHISLN